MPYALATVEGIIADARAILLDEVPPFRYSDPSLVRALNLALLEARRLRADLFNNRHRTRVPQYTSVNGEEVPIEPEYHLPLSYGVVAHAMLRDEEDVPVERANSFMNTFQSMLVTGMAVPTAPARSSGQ